MDLLKYVIYVDKLFQNLVSKTIISYLSFTFRKWIKNKYKMKSRKFVVW